MDSWAFLSLWVVLLNLLLNYKLSIAIRIGCLPNCKCVLSMGYIGLAAFFMDFQKESSFNTSPLSWRIAIFPCS